ncbi:O-antigen ligase family protein [Catalinimonas alkaloidigena]|uniref:O-antigen ligase family protein n=1 Tax=Catalinimonas alkaloidigena TaxID=1075417 RepID=UPI00115FFC4A|nr:O-antigen ligase family protein [Catalinimonas alkaloidigena]
MQTETEEFKLNGYYVFFALTMLAQNAYRVTHEYDHSLDFLFLVPYALLVFKYYDDLRELTFIFILGMLSNYGNWLSEFALLKSGSRVLFFDAFFIYLTALNFYDIVKKKQISDFFLITIYILMLLLWTFNFSRGLLSGEGGHAIGEARVYFGSIFLLIVPRVFRHKQDFVKLIKIISLCSFLLSFAIICMVVFRTIGLTGGSGRFNPGHAEAQFIMLGMIICMLDFFYGEKYCIFNVNRLLLIGFYLIIIVLSGVRSVLLISGVLLVLLTFLNSKSDLKKKIILIFGLIAAGLVAINLGVLQEVVEQQEEYAEGGGSTVDFRLGMWTIFLNKLFEDHSRLFFGRPFGLELIDISSLDWQSRDPYVDNSLAHNDYIAMAMTNGIVFSCMLLFMLLSYIIRGVLTARRAGDLNYIVLFMTIVLGAQTLISATNAEVKHYGTSILLWCHLSFLAVLFNHISNTKVGEAKNINRHTLVQSG